MAARTTMPKKQMRKKPIPPPTSFSTSDEGSPPPSISPLKKISAGPTAAVLRKHSEPSPEAGGGEKEEDKKPSEDSGNADPKRNDPATRGVTPNADDANDLLKKPSAATKTLARSMSMDEKPKEKDKSSKSEKEESRDEESSEDSWNAARQPNPPEQPRDSQTAKDGKQVVNTSSSSDSGSGDGEEDGKELKSRAEVIQPADPSKSVDGEEGEDEGSESEGEEESTADSESSEDFGNTATKENPRPPQPRDSQNMDEDKKPSNTSSSSGSGNDEKDIETRSSGRSLEPLSNKPIDSSAQPVRKKPKFAKHALSSRAQISKKKRTAVIVGAEGDHEKERFKRIWSNEDELALLQGILEYKERHHVIPYAQVHAEPLLKSVKDSLSITVSVHQINDKVRRMKKRYENTATRQFFAKKSKISDPHNAAVFDLSKKIWDPLKEESILLENKLPLEKKEENVNNTKIEELKHFAGEYPSLSWFLRSEHANNALLLQNQIPQGNTKKLEEKCKKLEMIDIQLNMRKTELLSSAVKLIKDALDKC